MATIRIRLTESDYFPFLRWFKARDASAKAPRLRPVGDELWEVRVSTGKYYLRGAAKRRWGVGRRLGRD